MLSSFFMKISRIYILLLCAAIAWCGLIVLAPLDASFNGSTFMSQEIYSFYGKVCHQQDSRSLHLRGEKFAVCARCSAVYFSFVGMLVVFPFLPKIGIRKSRLWILLALFPMVLDVALDVTGIHTSTIFTRLLTGSFFGWSIAYLLIPDLEEGVSGLFTSLKHHPD
jgi:uncharacterized membrane protein